MRQTHTNIAKSLRIKNHHPQKARPNLQSEAKRVESRLKETKINTPENYGKTQSFQNKHS